MNLLEIDYDTLMFVAIGAFALTGFLRGWWREGFTTLLLLMLVVLISQPDIIDTIIEYLNNLGEVLGLVVETRGEISVASLQDASATAEPVLELDPSNRNIYIILLIGVILVSYFGSRLTLPGTKYDGISFDPSVGARISGALIGAFNGFVIINLFKEYVIGRQIPGTGIGAASVAPSTLSVQIAAVPSENVFSGTSLALIIGVGVIIVIFLISRVELHTKPKVNPPLGYKQMKNTKL